MTWSQDVEKPGVAWSGDDAQSIYFRSGRGLRGPRFRPAPGHGRLPAGDELPLDPILRLATSIANARRLRDEARPPSGVPVAVGRRDVSQQAWSSPSASSSCATRTPLDETAVPTDRTTRRLEPRSSHAPRIPLRDPVGDASPGAAREGRPRVLRLREPEGGTPFKRLLKLLPKVGERTAATLYGRGRHAPTRSPVLPDGLPEGSAGSCPPEEARGHADARRRPSLLRAGRAIRFVVDAGGYADVAKSKFDNYQARLDDPEGLAQCALLYDGVESSPETPPFTHGRGATCGREGGRASVLSSVHQPRASSGVSVRDRSDRDRFRTCAPARPWARG